MVIEIFQSIIDIKLLFVNKSIKAISKARICTCLDFTEPYSEKVLSFYRVYIRHEKCLYQALEILKSDPLHFNRQKNPSFNGLFTP